MKKLMPTIFLNFLLVSLLQAQTLEVDYSTFLGGSGDEKGLDIAVAISGDEACVVGYTDSLNFPTANPFSLANAGAEDIFVTRFDSTGSALVSSTYIGGSGDERGYGVIMNSAGNIYVTGTTQSEDFPTLNSYQSSIEGSSYTDAFLFKLDSAGSGLLYSTYLGGGANDEGRGVDINNEEMVYVTGSTQSLDFPIRNSYQSTNAGNRDAFVTVFDSTGTQISCSTYLGGSSFDDSYDIVLDASGNPLIAGRTSSNDFPTENPYQSARSNGNDAFITKLTSDCSSLTASTYLGGTGNDQANALALDLNSAIYLTGTTISYDFPTRDAFQSSIYAAGHNDAFVTKLSSSGSAVSYSTYLGGNYNDLALDIIVDAADNAYVCGTTTSVIGFPTENPYQTQGNSQYTGYITRFDSSGSDLIFSTFFGCGNPSSTELNGIALPSGGGRFFLYYRIQQGVNGFSNRERLSVRFWGRHL